MLNVVSCGDMSLPVISGYSDVSVRATMSESQLSGNEATVSRLRNRLPIFVKHRNILVQLQAAEFERLKSCGVHSAMHCRE